MKKHFVKTLKNPFFQGSIILTAANFFAGFLNYFFNILTARVLGPEGFGEITAMFAYLVVLSTPIGILTTYLILKIGDKKDQYSFTASLFQWIILRIRKLWYLIIPVSIISIYLPQLTNLSPVVAYSILPIIILNYLLAFYDGAFQGLQLLTAFAILSIILAVTKLFGPVISLYWYTHINVILLFIFLSLVVKLILSHILLQKKFKENKSKIHKLNKHIMDIFKDKNIWLTAISSISIGLLSNIDIIYVKHMFSSEDAGIYSSWSLFAKIILYALGPLLSISFIFFSNRKHQIYHQLFFIGSSIFLLLVALGSLFVYGVYPQQIINILFGKKFIPLLPFMEWAGLFGVGYVTILFMNNYFLAKKSKFSLILAVSLPFYAGALFQWGSDISNVMMINIIYAFAVLALYLLAFFRARLVSLWE